MVDKVEFDYIHQKIDDLETHPNGDIANQLQIEFQDEAQVIFNDYGYTIDGIFFLRTE